MGQYLWQASRFLGDARVDWATGGDPAARWPLTTPPHTDR